MEQNIRFKIGSTFAGEGFQKANESVKDFGKAALAGKTAATQITGALSQIPGTAGKVATGLNSVATAFTKGGVAAGTMAAVMETVLFCFKSAAERAEKLVENVKAAGVAIQEKLGAAISNVLDPAVEKFKKVGEQVDRDEQSLQKMEAAAKKVAAAVGTANDTAGEARVVNLELEKLNTVLHAQNENAANLASAEYDLKIALENQKNDLSKHETKVAQARQDEDSATEKVTRATNNLAAAKDNLKTAQDALKLLEDSGCTDTKTLNTAKTNLTASENLVKTREDDLALATKDLELAHINVTTAINQQKVAVGKNDIAVGKTTDALDKLRKKIDQAEVAEMLANEAREDIAAAENKKAELTEKRTQTIESAETRREAALTNLADAHERYEEWERKAAEITETKYTKLQQINLQRLSDAFDKAPKTLSATQRQMVYDWREWLAHQDEKPWKDAIVQAEIEVQRVDEELKSSIRSIDRQIDGVETNIASLNSSLIACLKAK